MPTRRTMYENLQRRKQFLSPLNVVPPTPFIFLFSLPLLLFIPLTSSLQTTQDIPSKNRYLPMAAMCFLLVACSTNSFDYEDKDSMYLRNLGTIP
jgi:hypothetical protein